MPLHSRYTSLFNRRSIWQDCELLLRTLVRAIVGAGGEDCGVLAVRPDGLHEGRFHCCCNGLETDQRSKFQSFTQALTSISERV
jgi:hypothetical protein